MTTHKFALLLGSFMNGKDSIFHKWAEFSVNASKEPLAIERVIGKVLIIPRRHCADYFDLSAPEQAACWNMVSAVREILQNTIAPDGFNIGINIGQAAGQTIFHVHIRLIPRFSGDMQDPEGGVRGVIPERRRYF